MSRFSHTTTPLTAEISDVLDSHKKALNDQRWKMHDDIRVWEENLISQVREHAAKQKASIDEECDNQLAYISAKRQECVTTLVKYENKDDKEVIRQLLDECRAINVELSMLIYPEQSIQFIQIKKVKQSTKVNPDSSSTTFGGDRFDKKSLVNDNSTKDDDENAGAIPSARSPSAISKQRNQPSPTISSSPNSPTTGDDDTVNKCPACFMTFPPNMPTNDRTQHVNEHFRD